MDINLFVGNQCKVIEMVADISSNRMYVHLRNTPNNINNTNVISRDQIKLFSVTVGVVTHTFCGSTFYHMMYNNTKANIVLANELKYDTLHVGYFFCHEKTESFYAVTQNWLELKSITDVHHKFVFLIHPYF